MALNARMTSGCCKGSREEELEKLQGTLHGLLSEQLIDVHTMAEVLALARKANDRGINGLHREK